MNLSKSDRELYAAMEVADTLRSLRKQIEANTEENQKLGSVLFAIRAEEDKAQTRAWSKIIKKYPGVCRYLYGDRTEKFKKDLKKFSEAVKDLDEKTENKRKNAVGALLGLIITLSGLDFASKTIANFAAPWIVDTGWAVMKFQFRQYKNLFLWLKRNIDELGSVKELREECKKTKPKVPSKVQRFVQQNKNRTKDTKEEKEEE